MRKIIYAAVSLASAALLTAGTDQIGTDGGLAFCGPNALIVSSCPAGLSVSSGTEFD
ncbi:hypothetical protein AAHZ94_04780 [Streptomyces sp. HSW2009]|uniref:hypothetical protein n=1 Tax=Streptomyces sp. HSW2009 TaxID=3142890 RepID=UPI0032EF3DA0